MNNLSCVILCKDEGYELGKCIIENSLLNFLPSSNIIIVDSSNLNTTDYKIEKQICDDLSIKFIHKKIGDQNINGIADLRNFGSYSCPTHWILHIDCDELFSDKLFENIVNVINNVKNRIENNKVWAYKFPRINLPFYEQYPDYQTRLIYKEKCVWEGDVHEIVKILEDPFDHFLLREYPIIHKDMGFKSKIDKNIRWNKNIKNILICTLFKNSEKYLDRFLGSLKNEINNTINQKKINQKEYNVNIELCFLEGNSTDNTFDILKKFCKDMRLKYEINYILEKLNMNDSLERFQKLAMLRNILIKLGLRNKHNYVLMIDSDLIFNDNLIIKLIESIERNNVDVVAPMIMIEKFRTFDNSYFYDTLASIDKNGKNLEHSFPYFFTYENNIDENIIKKIIYRTPIEMKSVGTCYLAKAEIYNLNDFQNYSVNKCYKETENGNKIIYKYDGNKKSEQIEFFENLNNKYKTILDPSIKLLHINLENIGLKWH